MSNLTHRLRLIQSLDPHAYIRSTLDGSSWYVVASIDISDGQFLTSPVSHSDDPEEAVAAFFHRLCQVKLNGDEYIVARGSGDRLAYQWNGAAFTVVTQEARLA